MSEPAFDNTQSDGPTDESTTTTTDGVTVEKTVRRKDEETLSVEFTVTTTLDHPISLVIEEPIPADVTLEEIGFHSDYWNNWFVEENHLELCVDLEPEADHFTLYGVQADAETDPGWFLAEPTIDVTHKAGTAPTTEDDADAAATQQTTTTGTESDSQPTAPESDSESAVPDEESSTTDDSREPTDSSMLAALAADIEAADPDSKPLDVIRNTLDRQDTGSPTSVQVRLERVESEVNELAAYTDALEEFLDEYGDGQSLLQSIEAEHERFESRLDTTAQQLDTLDDQLDTLDDHASMLESLQADLEAVDSRLAALESGHEATDDRTHANEQALEGLSRSVSDLQDHVERVESTVADQTGDLQDTLQELENTVSGVQRWQQRFVDLVDVLSAPPALDGDDADTDDV